MDVPADIRCVQVKEDAQDVHGEVLAQIEQRDQQSLSQSQLKGVARTDAPDPSGAQQRAAVGVLPERLQVHQELVERAGLSPTSRSKERALDFSFFNRNTLEPTRFRLYCATDPRALTKCGRSTASRTGPGEGQPAQDAAQLCHCAR